MRALVTGANGFIGSYLTRRLVSAGDDVAALVRPRADLWRLDDVAEQMTLIEGDLRNLDPVAARLGAFAPEIVYHLAWGGVAGVDRDRVLLHNENLAATLALVRHLAQIDCQAFIGLGSQAEYGPRNERLDEGAQTNPTTEYGRGKLEASIEGRKIALNAGMRFCWVRVFSTYGPQDNPRWMIPYVIDKLLRGERPRLTACAQKWDYLYVDDAAEAISRLGWAQEADGVFNLGSGTSWPLRHVVERLRDLIDPGASIGFAEVAYRPDQVMLLEADTREIARATGWRPTTSLEEGLEKTVAWHRAQRQTSGH